MWLTRRSGLLRPWPWSNGRGLWRGLWRSPADAADWGRAPAAETVLR